MSDDIDIEEHDVLDNPRIKNIFPDIASIKTEVIDYEEGENFIKIFFWVFLFGICVTFVFKTLFYILLNLFY